MYSPVFIYKNKSWQEISKEDLEDYQFFVFCSSKYWKSSQAVYEPGVHFYGSYRTVGQAKTKITVNTTPKNRGKFRILARDRSGYNFYPLDIGSKYTDRNLWDDLPT